MSYTSTHARSSETHNISTARLLLLAFCLCIFVGTVNTPPRAQSVNTTSAANKLSAKDRAEAFEKIWRTVEEKYYDPNFNGVDWQAVRERFRPRLETVQTDAEFYRLMNEMVSELRDAHTRVRSPRQRRERERLVGTSTGLFVFEVEGQSVVMRVAPDTDAARAGVEAGMLVRTVDDKPVAERLAEIRQEVGNSSSPRATKVLLYGRLLAGEPDTALRLGLTRQDGTAFDVTLTRRIVSTAPKVESKLLPSGVAYIRFNRFRPEATKGVREALARFKDAPGLVIDLRNNGGGELDETLSTAGFFFNAKTLIARILTHTGKPPSFAFGLVKFPKEFSAGSKGKQLYAGKVVVLVNEASGSGAELFTTALQENGRARVVGTQSCGCVLGVMNHREVKGGGELDISEIGFVTAKNRRIEGDGVVPDKAITLRIVDLQRGRDLALEEAEQLLRIAATTDAP